MQLKKYHWKRIRESKPCAVCGEDHRTDICLTRKGKKRPQLIAPPDWVSALQ